MLLPKQHAVNEAWIAFKLNDRPMESSEGHVYDLVALMDSASYFLLGHAIVMVAQNGPSEQDALRLLMECRAHKQELPAKLFVPDGLDVEHLIVHARRMGVTVVNVSEEQVVPFAAEARMAFDERFRGEYKL